MRLVSAVLLALTVTLTTGCAMQPPRPEKTSFVIQITDNDPAKWNLALNNAKNVQHDLGAANSEVEIVAYGPGLNMLKLDSQVAGRIQDAEKAGVKVVACGNTMKAQKVTQDDLVPGVSVVPAGVIEIGSRQQQGWSYIRP